MTEPSERLKHLRDQAARRVISNVPQWSDINFLLSLLDSQADKAYAQRTPIGIQIANDAATRMRERCVKALRELRNKSCNASYQTAYGCAIGTIESLTLDGEQEQ